MIGIFFTGTNFVFGQDSLIHSRPKESVFPKVDSLKAVIVKANLRPRLKGDTIEYNTTNARLRAHSNVEELLASLPGLQIDKEGNITYNGEKIQHLLVDGEDIFKDNPSLVTRNFDASKIARVQLLDGKTDQALFTGVDDGARVKTLNLVLKVSEKNGYFGKLEAGSNIGGLYNSDAAIAAFEDKEQVTALGLVANTGVLWFVNGASNASSGVSFQGGASDALGASAGTGVPKFSGTAIHYANSWDGSKDHVVGNYQYSHFLTSPVTTIQTLQKEPGSLYFQEQRNRSDNLQDQHWWYGVYDWTPRRMGAFKFFFHGSSAKGQNQFSGTSVSSFNDTLINSSLRRIEDKVKQENIGGDLYWRLSSHRTDRKVSCGISVSAVDNSTQGYLNSVDKFYRSNGIVQSRDTVDQRKEISGRPISLTGSFSYTEPLWKGALVAVAYNVSTIRNNTLQETYARGDGKYLVVVDSLSSRLKAETITQRGILNLQGTSGKLSYTIGSDWTSYSYRQGGLLLDSNLHQRYVNWSPKVIIHWELNATTKLQFFYTSVTQEPSITQLQPIKTNNDPLHLTIGNPGLQPTHNQNIRLEFYRIGRWIVNLGLSVGLTSKSISNKTTTDSFGRQVTQPVNVNGGRSVGGSVSFSRKIFGIDAGFRTYGSYSRAFNFVNEEFSQNDIYVAGGGVSLNRNVSDKYLFQLFTNFTYFDQSSSINAAVPIHYWTESHRCALTIFFRKGYEFNTDATYSWQQRSNSFTGKGSMLLWNSYISRNLAGNKLIVKIQWNNILNQNSGISRASLNNTTTETSTNILGRFWLVTFSYHFDRKFKKNK